MEIQERKIELIARRFYRQLGWYELFLYPFMLVGAVVYFSGRVWGGSLLLLAGLIQAMVYMVLWYHPSMSIRFRFAALGLSFGLLGSVFFFLNMQSDKVFLALGIASLLAALLLQLRQGLQQTDRKIIYRITLMLIWLLTLGLRLIGLF